MLQIKNEIIDGASFDINGPNGSITYTCIGHGQNPASGADYIVGATYDHVNNRTNVKTFLLREVTFKGDLFKIPTIKS